MKKVGKERRKYLRYDTEAKIYFRVHYSLKTKVKFRLLQKSHEDYLSREYSGLTKDISVEGLRFRSEKKLRKGNYLYLEMYLPKRKEPVWMEGNVRWSKKLGRTGKGKFKYDTGVLLTTIMGESVPRSVYFDKKYRVVWSSVLTYAFGSFSKFSQKN